MRTRFWKTTLAIMAVCVPLATPPASDAGQRRGRAARAAEQSLAPSRPPETNGRGRLGVSRIYLDPASTTGYDSGYDRGLIDGRDGQRYDPVKHRDYRDAQKGYASSYGSKDAYRTNFRSGFRQGYEDGYREGGRTR